MIAQSSAVVEQREKNLTDSLGISDNVSNTLFESLGRSVGDRQTPTSASRS